MLEELCQSVHESASFLGERSRANEIVLCLRHRIDLVVTHYYLVGLSLHIRGYILWVFHEATALTPALLWTDQSTQ